MTEPNTKGFRAGFVPITGLPNAGKSTLMNALCGVRLSIISEKPQTTRNNILGILNAPGLQAVFVDTPGFLRGRNLFERSMAGAIRRAASEEGDLCVLITEPGLPPEAKVPLFEPLKKVSCPLYLAVNKTDKERSPGRGRAAAAFFSSLLPVARVFMISALSGTGLSELRSAIKEALPEHPPYYPQDQLTDRWERFYVAEIIREQIFRLYSQEVPYSSAVEIEEFHETPDHNDQIRAAVHVARAGQKPILIGRGGRSIKDLRERAQKAIAAFLGRPVELHLTVKVTPGWQDNVRFLREIGFYEKK
ncbi:MAG: GTPase Era [Elusimicrobia bacterium CG08_land_8_20_14_0_20_59_10]|nr:MAG: GTPase Era [Elusimicrobia bacterium CG08_land_8_20_14_0_20_59_10]